MYPKNQKERKKKKEHIKQQNRKLSIERIEIPVVRALIMPARRPVKSLKTSSTVRGLYCAAPPSIFTMDHSTQDFYLIFFLPAPVSIQVIWTTFWARKEYNVQGYYRNNTGSFWTEVEMKTETNSNEQSVWRGITSLVDVKFQMLL